ncbi:MAG: response regulator transcription factor [Syntrophales bacterium]|jgi:DNA-binding NarL/FixJ family response regulator|nr:response regulator transcription factor [Syntrophales bacterium]MDY0043735.1 response regulator transcription factor [Syntrophales bacterium]
MIADVPSEGSTRTKNGYKVPEIKLLIVDDHEAMRKGLATLLGMYDGLQVIGEASDGKEAVKMAESLLPDVILMDIRMPEMDGIEATRIIHRQHPRIMIIGLSTYDSKEHADAMADAGAAGFYSKSDSCEVLIAAIKNTLHG